MKSVRTTQLSMQVNDRGPKTGPALLLLHGWPDDASTWDAIAPRLNEAGFRTIAPMHRGFAGARFLSTRTPRTGNTGVLAQDAIELMDALSIERFSIAGHDWGSNVAETMAVSWPKRVLAIAMLSTPYDR